MSTTTTSQPLVKAHTIDAADHASFMAEVVALKTPHAARHMLHCHEYPADGQRGDTGHDLADCAESNFAVLGLSNPALFGGTFMRDGVAYISYGFVAGKL